MKESKGIKVIKEVFVVYNKFLSVRHESILSLMFLIYKAFEWSSGQLRTLHAMQLKRLLMREFMQFPDISVTKPFKKIKSQVFANYFKESFHAHLRNSTYYAVKNNSFRRSLCSFFGNQGEYTTLSLTLKIYTSIL